MRRSALESDKWGRWRPLVVVGGADGGPGQRRWGGVGGTACMGRQSRTGPMRRDLHPGVPRLVVDLHTVLSGDVAGLSVDPGARVGGIPQNVMYVGLTPHQLAGLGRDSLVGQPHGNGAGPHALMNVHVDHAEHNFGLLFHDLGPAVVSDAVPMGRRPVGTRPCLAARQRTEASRFLHCDAVGWGNERSIALPRLTHIRLSLRLPLRHLVVDARLGRDVGREYLP